MKPESQTSNQDIYQSVTTSIIELLEQVSVEDYQAPFASLAAQGLPYNPVTKKHYQGINIPYLWITQQKRGYLSNQFASFKQWQEMGAKVKKGERGSRIIFYKTLIKSDTNEQGEEATSKIPMLRLYTVFNAAQVEGYEHRESPSPNHTDLVERLEQVDQYCTHTKATIRHGNSSMAYYNHNGDYIHMPDTMEFIPTKDTTATEGYYATLLHELVHWTGAKHRLDRFKENNHPEKIAYAKEELVAELGSAFLCAQLNISQTTRQDHARYIKSWLQAFKNDNKYVFRASAEASRAVEYLNQLQFKI